jgi:hypothetical protein
MKVIRVFIHNHVDGKKRIAFCLISLSFIWLFPEIFHKYILEILPSIWLILEILKRHTEEKRDRSLI